MDDQLKKLKKTMDNSVFKKMSFSPELQNKVLANLQRSSVTTEQLKREVLSILSHQALTGYELLIKMEQIGEKYFENHEGELYQLLHQFEQDELLNGEWLEEDKYYLISKKGKKYLRKMEKEHKEKLSGQERWT
ncbi:PadR family transcriptional regulator [Alkalihalobacillus sp. 1P02AB]|uniref:PadR family transcriptional regulator n=1 Tax=Alkalihalobacillus sp. 1P02AB TaxID=3132260 RepID=UPI0039A4B65F